MMDTDGTDDHAPLAKCRVLYLGSAPVSPRNTVVKISDIQDSIASRYQPNYDGNVKGIDTWLTVLKSGFKVQYIGEEDQVLWFPIQTLSFSAAVRYCDVIDGDDGTAAGGFLPLNHPHIRSHHPPIFAMVIRRYNRALSATCHSFICKTSPAAMALVKSSTHAYNNRSEMDDDIPVEILQNELIVSPSPNNRKPARLSHYVFYDAKTDRSNGTYALNEGDGIYFDSYYDPYTTRTTDESTPITPVSHRRLYGGPISRSISPAPNRSPPRRHNSPRRHHSQYQRHLSPPRRHANDNRRNVSSRGQERHTSPVRPHESHFRNATPSRRQESHHVRSTSPSRHQVSVHGRHVSPLRHNERHTSPSRHQAERNKSPYRNASPNRSNQKDKNEKRNIFKNGIEPKVYRPIVHQEMMNRSTPRRNYDWPYSVVPEQADIYY